MGLDKLKKSFVLTLLGMLAALIARFWIGSLRIRSRVTVSGMEPFANSEDAVRIFLCWHDVLLVPGVLFRPCGGYILVSASDDGEYANAILTRLGWQTVRGSSTSGGRAAREEFLNLGKRGDPADWYLTPDGPKGPRHVLKFGAIYLASKTGYPIVPIGVAYDRPWLLKSWDRFALPRPFSRVCIVYGCPVRIPAIADGEVLSQFEALVQDQMDRVEEEATSLLACARGGLTGAPYPRQSGVSTQSHGRADHQIPPLKAGERTTE